MHQMGMCEAMADLGHDVTLHVRPGEEPTADDFAFYGVNPIFRLAKHARPQMRGLGAFVNAASVGRHLRQPPLPDLLYAREQYGLAASVGTGVPFVFEAHWKPLSMLQREVQGWLLRRPNFRRLVLISDGLRRIYREQFPWLAEDRVIVAHDAANPPATVLPRAAANTPGRLQLGYVGGMLPGYGIEIIVGVAKANSDVDVHVVGGKDDAIQHWRNEAQNVANLTFHGFIAPQLLAPYYASFDVMLAPFQRTAPSIQWISPMKIFEYMAYGKAIICSDFPIMREILTDRETALLVAADDVDSWSRALRSLQDPPLRTRLGDAALAKLRSQHTWRRRSEIVLGGLG